MAWTDRYVTAGAAGGGDGSSGNPWTLDEAFSNAVAGDRINIKSGNYTATGSLSQSNVGNITAPIWFRGYNTTIGDLVGARTGTNGSGILDVANYPDIDMGINIFSPASSARAWTIWESLYIHGTRTTSEIVSNTNADGHLFVHCRIVNSSSSSTYGAINIDNECGLINSDFESTGTNHSGYVVQIDGRAILIDCRVGTASSSSGGISLQDGTIANCTIIGAGGGNGINYETPSLQPIPVNNTIVNWNRGISGFTGSPSVWTVILKNMLTDNAFAIYNPYQATSNVPYFGYANRYRDNTSGNISGYGDTVDCVHGQIISDTGDSTSDYESPSSFALSGDYRIKLTSPAFESITPLVANPGAYQSVDQGGGSGGGWGFRRRSRTVGD